MHRPTSATALAVFALAASVLVGACEEPQGFDLPGEDVAAGDGATLDDTDSDTSDDVGARDDADADAAPSTDADAGTSGDVGSECVDGSVRPCFSGDAEQLGIGTCSVGTQICELGAWTECSGERQPEDEYCDGLDNDCDGETDEGVSNACGGCGAIPLEVCDDGLDNDCDGTIDGVADGCACGGRLDQPCYSGRPSTLGVGICRGGTFDCIAGAWGECEGETTSVPEVCDGLDNDCDGSTDEGTRNACGGCEETVPAEVCDAFDNDCDGVIDEGVRGVCGLCLDELGEEVCGDGFDNDCDGDVDEACACFEGTEVCYPGPPAALGVGQCAAGTRTCDATGELWGACSGFVLPTVEVCDGIDNDCDGAVDLRPNGCSLCGVELEICDGDDNDCDGLTDEGLVNECGDCIADVIPEETLGPEYCDGLDDDCDGLIDEGLLNECGTCDDEECSDCEFFVPGWSDTERCADGQDNDGNGVADEDCPCEFGTSQACFLGAPNSRRIGACLDGSQTCVDRADPHWGPCLGGILPEPEICDGKDNDCNGCIDDGETCDLELTCPVEDFTVPLRNYNLLGDTIFDGVADEWHWTVEAPAGSATPGPVDPNARNTYFFVDVSGDYRITLTITIDGEEISCTWLLHAAGTGLRVELIWDRFGSVDLDLHLHRPDSTADWCDSRDDCFYANCDDGDSPPWGYADSTEGCPGGASSCPNPRLDIDNIRGDDPENINIDNPNDGDSFRIMVHDYSEDSGVGTTLPEVRIYCGGRLAAELGVPPDTVPMTTAQSACRGDTWRVADVEMHIDAESGVASCTVSVLEGSGAGGWDIRRDDTSY